MTGTVCAGAGIARGDERDERRAPLGAQLVEGGVDAAHGRTQNSIPEALPTVCMSLSPRPERFTSRMRSLRIVGAIFIA